MFLKVLFRPIIIKYTIIFFIIALFNCACNNTTIFDFIENNNISEINRYVAENKNIKLKNKEGLSPLMFAIKLNRNDAAKILIKGGADINELTTKGITPLIVAIKYKNIVNYQTISCK